MGDDSWRGAFARCVPTGEIDETSKFGPVRPMCENARPRAGMHEFSLEFSLRPAQRTALGTSSTVLARQISVREGGRKSINANTIARVSESRKSSPARE